MTLASKYDGKLTNLPQKSADLVGQNDTAQWFDIGTSIFFVNEICSWDIYLSIKA
jgi:hypothetical protein